MKSEKELLKLCTSLLVIVIISAIGMMTISYIARRYRTQYEELKTSYEELKTSYDKIVEQCPQTIETQLLKCPKCNSQVKVQLVRESSYIECPNCKLRTGYFDTTRELIHYWNNTTIDSINEEKSTQ